MSAGRPTFWAFTAMGWGGVGRSQEKDGRKDGDGKEEEEIREMKLGFRGQASRVLIIIFILKIIFRVSEDFRGRH